MLYSVTSGFRREVDEICDLQGCYAAHSGNSLPTFRDTIGPIFKVQAIQEEILYFYRGADKPLARPN